jgi:hypothetical protein
MRHALLLLALTCTTLSPACSAPPDEPAQPIHRALIGRGPFPGWDTCLNPTTDAVPLHYVRYWVHMYPGSVQDCFQVNLANRSPHNISTVFWSASDCGHACANYHIAYVKANVTNFVEFSSSSTWQPAGCLPWPSAVCYYYGSFTGQGSAFHYDAPTQQAFDPSGYYMVPDPFMKALYAADSPL